MTNSIKAAVESAIIAASSKLKLSKTTFTEYPNGNKLMKANFNALGFSGELSIVTSLDSAPQTTIETRDPYFRRTVAGSTLAAAIERILSDWEMVAHSHELYKKFPRGTLHNINLRFKPQSGISKNNIVAPQAYELVISVKDMNKLEEIKQVVESFPIVDKMTLDFQDTVHYSIKGYPYNLGKSSASSITKEFEKG